MFFPILWLFFPSFPLPLTRGGVGEPLLAAAAGDALLQSLEERLGDVENQRLWVAWEGHSRVREGAGGSQILIPKCSCGSWGRQGLNCQGNVGVWRISAIGGERNGWGDGVCPKWHQKCSQNGTERSQNGIKSVNKEGQSFPKMALKDSQNATRSVPKRGAVFPKWHQKC